MEQDFDFSQYTQHSAEQLRERMTNRQHVIAPIPHNPEAALREAEYWKRVRSTKKAELRPYRPDYTPQMEFEEARVKFGKLLKAREAELAVFKRRSDFKITFTPEQAQIVRDLLKWFINDESSALPIHKGFYLYGSPGTFKTEIVKLLCKFAQQEQVPKALQFMDISQISDELLAKGPDVLEQVRMYDRVFDEWGRKTLPVSYFGNKVDPAEWALEMRYKRFKSFGQITCFISNFDPQTLEKNLSEMAFDRLGEMATSVRMPGESRRNS